MGSLTLVLPDEIEITFRKICTIKFGDKRGKLAKGATEAIADWNNKEKQIIEKQ